MTPASRPGSAYDVEDGEFTDTEVSSDYRRQSDFVCFIDVILLSAESPCRHLKSILIGKLLTGYRRKLREEDPHRLEQRQKAIDKGKNTRAYAHYLKVIPK